MFKKAFTVLLLVTLFAAVSLYLRADESKQRFVKNMLRQLPYLPGRYLA